MDWQRIATQAVATIIMEHSIYLRLVELTDEGRVIIEPVVQSEHARWSVMPTFLLKLQERLAAIDPDLDLRLKEKPDDSMLRRSRKDAVPVV